MTLRKGSTGEKIIRLNRPLAPFVLIYRRQLLYFGLHLSNVSIDQMTFVSCRRFIPSLNGKLRRFCQVFGIKLFIGFSGIYFYWCKTVSGIDLRQRPTATLAHANLDNINYCLAKNKSYTPVPFGSNFILIFQWIFGK